MKVVSVFYYSQQERKLACYANQVCRCWCWNPPLLHCCAWVIPTLDTYSSSMWHLWMIVYSNNAEWRQKNTMMLSHANALKVCELVCSLPLITCLQPAENWKGDWYHFLGRVWSKRSNILNIKWKILKGLVINSQVFKSICCACPSARFSDGHAKRSCVCKQTEHTYEHSLSIFPQSFFCAGFSQSWHWATDANLLHVNKCHMKQVEISSELHTDTTDVDMQQHNITKWSIALE